MFFSFLFCPKAWSIVEWESIGEHRTELCSIRRRRDRKISLSSTDFHAARRDINTRRKHQTRSNWFGRVSFSRLWRHRDTSRQHLFVDAPESMPGRTLKLFDWIALIGRCSLTSNAWMMRYLARTKQRNMHWSKSTAPSETRCSLRRRVDGPRERWLA